ncbi:MAG: SCO family protein [Alphaproteobacteria bacterium]|nr:SCO family protein [Alphaproteobacteria bacterium]
MAAKVSLLARIRLVLWGLVAVAAVVVGALFLGQMQEAARQGASLPGAARFGGDFELVDQNSKTFSSDSLKGRPYAVFFGFTHCPDICPTTLFEMTRHLEALGPKADRLQVLFITVDPARDTPEQLQQYLSAFDPRIVGLSGSEAQIADVAKKYRIVAEKVVTSDGSYTMNHTATVFLFDGKGALTSTLSWEEDEKTRQAKLQRLVDRG